MRNVKKAKSSGRLGKKVIASMNQEAYGDEYEFDHPIDYREADTAFTWYSLNCDQKQAKRFVVDYLEEVGRKEDLKKVNALSDLKVFVYMSSACWLSRMWSNGITFSNPQKWTDMFERNLARLYSKAEEMSDAEAMRKPTQKMKRPVIDGVRSPAEQRFDSYLKLLNEAVDAIDVYGKDKLDPRYTIYPKLKDASLEPEYVKDAIAEIGEIEESLAAAIREPEGADRREIAAIRRRKEVASSIVQELKAFLSSSGKPAKGEPAEPKVRKPRRKKPVSVEKLVSRMKFLEKDDELGIASIDSTKVVGAQELWVYNVKYATLTVYKSANESGLGIRGTTLLNFDETSSVAKKIGRKAKEVTAEVVGCGKVQLRKVMTDIKSTPTKPNGRINENTVLLRAIG